MPTTTLPKHLIAESHRRQFEGEDYQAVANDIAERAGIKFEDEAYKTLSTSRDPGCDCGFCATADWQD